jgi:hypothetical protein
MFVTSYETALSPNLNLIERLWKHVKGRLRIKSYDDFNDFKKKIDSITDSTDKSDKSTLDRLIGEKVQLFNFVVFENIVEFPAASKTIKKRKKAA